MTTTRQRIIGAAFAVALLALSVTSANAQTIPTQWGNVPIPAMCTAKTPLIELAYSGRDAEAQCRALDALMARDYPGTPTAFGQQPSYTAALECTGQVAGTTVALQVFTATAAYRQFDMLGAVAPAATACTTFAADPESQNVVGTGGLAYGQCVPFDAALLAKLGVSDDCQK